MSRDNSTAIDNIQDINKSNLYAVCEHLEAKSLKLSRYIATKHNEQILKGIKISQSIDIQIELLDSSLQSFKDSCISQRVADFLELDITKERISRLYIVFLQY